MKTLALYKEYTLPIMRRVKAPFEVLAKRNHPFSFMQVNSFLSGLAHGADVTVLPNWILDDEELEALRSIRNQRTIVYDLSDPLLMDNNRVREQIRLCHLVTVPNEYLKKEVRIIHHAVEVLPSCVDLPYFMLSRNSGEPSELPLTFIGCLGPYNWYLLKDVLPQILKRYPSVLFIGGKEATRTLGDLIRPMEFDLNTYHTIVNMCQFGLCPVDGPNVWDKIWEQEYGILCRPVINLSQDRARSPEAWVDAIRGMHTKHSERSALGNMAFIHANKHRSEVIADTYLKVYRKKLPHLGISLS